MPRSSLVIQVIHLSYKLRVVGQVLQGMSKLVGSIRLFSRTWYLLSHSHDINTPYKRLPDVPLELLGLALCHLTWHDVRCDHIDRVGVLGIELLVRPFANKSRLPLKKELGGLQGLRP